VWAFEPISKPDKKESEDISPNGDGNGRDLEHADGFDYAAGVE